MIGNEGPCQKWRKVTKASACLIFWLTCFDAPGVAAAPLQWFYLTERLAFPAGVEVAVALGAKLDVAKIRRALPHFAVDAEEYECVSTVSISYEYDKNVGVTLYPKNGLIVAIQTFGSAGDSAGIRVGMPIDQVPGATPARCNLDDLTAMYDCATGSAFHYRVDPSKCLLAPLPEKLPGFADCLAIVSITIGEVPEQ